MSTDFGLHGTGLAGRRNQVQVVRGAAGGENGGGVLFQLTGPDGFVQIRLEALACLFVYLCHAEGRNPRVVIEEATGRKAEGDGS